MSILSDELLNDIWSTYMGPRCGLSTMLVSTEFSAEKPLVSVMLNILL